MDDNLGFNGDSMMGPTLPDLTEQSKAPEPVNFNTFQVLEVDKFEKFLKGFI